MTEAQMMQWQTDLKTLEQKTSELEKLMTISGADLSTAQTALLESKKEQERLSEQLTELQELTKKQEESLQTSERLLQETENSWKKSERLAERERRKLERKKTIWEVLAIAATIAAVVK